MTDEDPIVGCSACGVEQPRSDMFGVEPDLLCPRCASGVRQRMQVRVRPGGRLRRPYVTIASLAICVALFACTHLLWRTGTLSARPAWLQGLYQDGHIWVGEVWRHFTCVFLHAAWWHIGLNGMALWYLGRHVEAGWGSWALAALIVFTGVCASAAEWMMQGSGVGISGALFGLCGFLWALRRAHPIAAAVMNDQQVRWILTLLVVGVVLSASGSLAIGNWAHGVGLATGYLAGMAVGDARRRLWVPLLGVLMVALVAASVRYAFGTVTLTRDGGRTWFEESRSSWREEWLRQNGYEP